MDYNPASSREHHDIIVVIDYLTKWAEAMHIIKSYGNTATFFVFNHIIAYFIIPRDIFIDHGSHFHNEIMKDLASKLGFKNGNSSRFYP
jgi:DMSO/TMAO reductase YedYZ heme-binding membrane subunit